MACCRSLRVPEQQLEEGGEVVRLPLSGRVGLAEPELPAGREAAEESCVLDPECDRRPGAEAPQRAVRQRDLERSALELPEQPSEHARGYTADQRQPGERLATDARDGAHGRSEPFPGTNGGLW